MPVILITGTSTGIGQAAAIHLARRGNQVIATMRTPEASPELEQLAREETLQIRVLPLDVNSEVSVSKAFQKAGPIDVLINNAGIGHVGPIEEASIEQVRAVMETNFIGALRCIQAALPEMRNRRSGTIINITSVAGRLSSGAHGIYAASKSALEAASEALAGEVAQYGIRVAVVEPGVIATPIFGKASPADPETRYPHSRRMNALFAAALEDPVSPFVVAEKIEEILNNGTRRFRYPAGPDAEPLLAWRKAMSDQEWIGLQALDNESWAEEIKNQFGLEIDLR
jgi:NAD(P)-dependent dehydrogenase (short-subunit alcohol dehydrogenase family)